jgi:hypothetical protein
VAWCFKVALGNIPIALVQACISSRWERSVEQDALIAKMRGRVEQCRRLARLTTDSQIAITLNEMADEAEADIRRTLAEKSNGS